MGIFERLYTIAKAELNDRLRRAGMEDDPFDDEREDLDAELRRLEEEMRRAAENRERANARSDQTQDRNRQTHQQQNRRQQPSAYDVIGISPRSSQDEIRDHYRVLAKKYHPDRVQRLSPEFQESARQKMKEINQAYNMISNTRKRREYDQKMGFF